MRAQHVKDEKNQLAEMRKSLKLQSEIYKQQVRDRIDSMKRRGKLDAAQLESINSPDLGSTRHAMSTRKRLFGETIIVNRSIEFSEKPKGGK